MNEAPDLEYMETLYRQPGTLTVWIVQTLEYSIIFMGFFSTNTFLRDAILALIHFRQQVYFPNPTLDVPGRL
jgi:hypothetical protein